MVFRNFHSSYVAAGRTAFIDKFVARCVAQEPARICRCAAEALANDFTMRRSVYDILMLWVTGRPSRRWRRSVAEAIRRCKAAGADGNPWTDLSINQH